MAEQPTSESQIEHQLDAALPRHPEAAVETQGLSKRYGRFVALRNLDMVVVRGSIYGFIGPNGAGKTTTMRILTTLLAPSAGEAWVAGHSVTRESAAVRGAIGYMPDFFGVYDDMRVWEYLDFFAAAYKVPAAKRIGMTADLLALVDLTAKRDDNVDSLSRGMKQRLGIARTLVHDPQLLILDEPASGLDPHARIELRELLKALRGMGKTILISSHILSELAELCTHVGIIERGRLLASGAISEIMQRLQPARVLRIGLLDASEAAITALQGADGVLDVSIEDVTNGAGTTLRVRISGSETMMHDLLARLLAANIPVYSFAEEQSDLEDIFLRVTQGLVALALRFRFVSYSMFYILQWSIMRFDILTLFPSMFVGPLGESILKRASDAGLLDIRTHNIRDYAIDKHKSVDDYPYGGGAGMVMRVDVLARAVEAVKEGEQPPVILMSPQGRVLTQTVAAELAQHPRLVLVCGHYEGIDERASTLCNDEISIGDYVLTGGELAAMVVVEAVSRLLPHVLAEASPTEESHSTGLLEYPQYTRPPEWRGMSIPPVLLSGHHAQIAQWRRKEALRRTLLRRPDLLDRAILTPADRKLLAEIEQENIATD